MKEKNSPALTASDTSDVVVVASQSAPQWLPVDITPRLSQMNRIFAVVKYKTPPSDKITLGNGFLEAIINAPSDKDRFGVPEYGTYRFWFDKNEVEKLC